MSSKYTLEQVQAMPWPLELIGDMQAEMNRAEYEHDVEFLRTLKRKHYITQLETDRNLEVSHEKVPYI